jgi:hypothetical protein
MAAKGTNAKNDVVKKILSTFEGAFLYNDGKEIRIPMVDSGEYVQIKCVLTCAAKNVENGDDSAIPGAAPVSGDFPAPKMTAPTPQRDAPVAPSAEEKANVAAMLKKLGL